MLSTDNSKCAPGSKLPSIKALASYRTPKKPAASRLEYSVTRDLESDQTPDPDAGGVKLFYAWVTYPLSSQRIILHSLEVEEALVIDLLKPVSELPVTDEIHG